DRMINGPRAANASTPDSPESADLALEQERDHEGEQHERLDEREAENHRRRDARSSTGVTADALERCGSSTTLTRGAAEDGQADCDASADGSHRLHVEGVGGAALLSREGRGGSEGGECGGSKGQLRLEHFR